MAGKEEVFSRRRLLSTILVVVLKTGLKELSQEKLVGREK